MTAREELERALEDWGHPANVDSLLDAYRDEVATDMGRDALRDDLRPFLDRLVGERNARAFFNAHAHELAEKQRNWDAEAEGYTDPQMAVYAAADFIDPED